MRRRLVVCAGLFAGLAAGGLVVQRAVARPPSDNDGVSMWRAASPIGALVETAELRSAAIVVERVQGRVERRGLAGAWVLLESGDRLVAEDVVRTAAESSARLQLGDNVLVTVAERTELMVGQVSDTLSRVRLDDGRLGSVVNRSRENFRFRVEIHDSDVLAETGEGKFGVLKRGQGAVTVVSDRGEVSVSSKDEEVRVGAGEQTVVEEGKGPTKPVKIPASLFLKVGQAIPVRAGERRVQVNGQTIPGASVRIDGASAGSWSHGRFKHGLVLRRGANVIVVEVEDALGRRLRRELPVVTLEEAPKATTEPRLDANVRW